MKHVVVFDNEGNQAVSVVKEIIIDEAEEVDKPFGQFTIPVDGTSITTASSIRFEVNATDSDGFVDKVEFYVNGEQASSVAYDASYPQSISLWLYLNQKE